MPGTEFALWLKEDPSVILRDDYVPVDYMLAPSTSTAASLQNLAVRLLLPDAGRQDQHEDVTARGDALSYGHKPIVERPAPPPEARAPG